MTQKPPSFRRRPACMDAGGRAASGTKAEESSGFNNPCPQGGNGIKGWHWVSLARSGRNGAPLTPRSAFLDSSLRWNDDGADLENSSRTGGWQ